MKRLTKLLCLAIAMLWVLPVSATEFDQHGRAVLANLTPPSLPELESVEPLSDWIAVEVNEYRQFDIAEYEVAFELLNAVWDSTDDKNLVIEAFDETGASLATSNVFAYNVNTTFIPFVLTIDSNDIGNANNFVNNLHTTEPDTRRIQIRPTLVIEEVQDCDQQVMMKTWFRYSEDLVGRDEPDHLVVPSILLNSC